MKDASQAPVPLDPHVLGVQALFVQHQQQLRAFVLALTPDFTVADDVMQETFLEISRQAEAFAMGSSFQAWARSIARFKVLSALRDRKRCARALADDVIDVLVAAAPAEDPEGRHEAELGQLRTCLERLAPAARELIHLRYAGEHMPEAIASLRAQSVGAVNVTLARARAALRACVERGLKTDGVRL